MRRTGDLDGRWHVVKTPHATSLDINGTVARLRYLGREFELHGVRDLRGMISTEQVDLKADDFHLYADGTRVHIKTKEKVSQIDLPELPPGMVVFERGVIRVDPARR